MSFGFSIGDAVAVGTLAWKLYTDCYKVARDAPQEFQLLVSEMATMSSSLKMLQEEMEDPNSSLHQCGEDRVELVNGMIRTIRKTLLSLENYATRYEISGVKPTSKLQFRQRIRNFKWALHRKSIEELRSKLHQHNGLLTLLLTSAGNSSLQRIQSSTNTLEDHVRMIRDYLTSQQAGKDILAPSLSLVDDDLMRSSISAVLLEHAEVVQPWTTIGVTQWIDTGRWWLQGCELELYLITNEGADVPVPTYASLLKASWILVDIIACHPQVTFISAKTRTEIVALCVGIKRDLERIESLKLKAPQLHELQNADLQIWEDRVTVPTLRRHQNPLLDAQNVSDVGTKEVNFWAVEGDEVAFFIQRAACKVRARASAIICDVLFLIRQDISGARLVANTQAQTEVIDISFTSPLKIEFRSDSILVNDCEIVLKRREHIELLSSLVETANFYFQERKQANNSLEAMKAYLFLVILKNQYISLAKGSSEMPVYVKPELDLSDEPKCDASVKIVIGTSASVIDDANNRLLSELLSDQKGHARQDMCLFSWAIQIGHEGLVKLFLDEDAQYAKDSWHDFSPLMLAARCSHEPIARLLIADATAKGKVQQDLAAKQQDGWTALHYACSHGDERIARLFLRSKADINSEGEYRNRPLHCTAFHNKSGTTQLLLDKGADADKKNNGGSTPLMEACKARSEHVIRVLLNEGVDVNAQDNTHSDALTYALEFHDWGLPRMTKATFDKLSSHYWGQKGPVEPLAHEVRSSVTFEVDSDWAMLILDSPHARFEYCEDLPNHIRSVHDRVFRIEQPPGAPRFFNYKFHFYIVHRHEVLDFSTEHGTLGASGYARTKLAIENGGQFETSRTNEGRNFRRHCGIKVIG